MTDEDIMRELIESQRAEIERLTKIAQKACDETFENQTEINQLRVEIEKRAALEPKP